MGIHPAILRRKKGGSLYNVLGNEPALVGDMVRDMHRNAGVRQTFDNIFTHSRLGNAAMVDSDGLIKWAPHNLALNSATPATQSITVVSGADYTVECTGSGSITLSGAGSGTVTEGSPVEITASTTSLTLTVSGSVDLMWCYRSDLGGMAPVPLDARVAGSTTYVPTTSTAKYLPRRHNHIYNGTAWVDAGTLVETEARTNLVTYSEDFTDAAWFKFSAATLAVDATGPDGETSAVTLVDNSGGGTANVYVEEDVTVSTSTAYTFSAFLKADQLSWAALRTGSFTTGDGVTYFNLSTGAAGTTTAAHTTHVEDVGGGWFRCAITFTTDAADTSGKVYIYVADGDNDATVDLDGTSSILIYGAQFEAASTPSSYIPTNGSTVTRAADTNGLVIDSSVVNTMLGGSMPAAVCIQMKGRMTYADTSSTVEAILYQWQADASNYIRSRLWTFGTPSPLGQPRFAQNDAGTFDEVIGDADTYSPGINVPFNIASRHGSTFVNGAVDGTALTEDTTPVALPDLSSTDLQIGQNFMGNIEEVRVWVVDIGDAGIAEASA